jgi:hypothetical protein
MARQVSNKTKAILKYTEQGLSAKDIAKKVKVSTQAVYNVQYKARQRSASKTGSSGIAAAKKPTQGMGTGITSLPTVATTPTIPLELTKPIVKTKPTLWQRIKQVFGWQ